MTDEGIESVPDSPTKKHPIRSSFLTGLIALLPIVITMFVIALVWNAVIDPLSVPLGKLITKILSWVTAEDTTLKLPVGLGQMAALLLAVVFVYALGWSLTSIFGRRLMGWTDRFFSWLPVVRFIYPHAKQLSEFLFGARKFKFNRVVAIEYPRKGIYTIGFVTSGGIDKLSDAHGHRMLAVFVPTSPTPFTGWTVLVDEREVTPVDMTVDQAVRFAVTCGVITPDPAGTRALPAVEE